MELIIIAAVADDGAIGKDNALLWHLPEDMKFFRKATTGYPVIMGRNTFLSIGKPLPKRRNIVISRTLPETDGVEVVGTLSEAVELVKDERKCFVMGGGKVYAQAIDLADTMYITHVHTLIPDADTFFPQVNPLQWEMTSHSDTFSENALTFNFAVYKRISQ